jgi:CRP-like cAMP-binding protein
MVGQEPMVGEEPRDSFEERLQLLSQCGFFDRLSRGEKADVVDALDMVEVDAGDALFLQGDPGDAMYIVDRGLLEVRATMAGGRDETLDRLDPGASVGEMALITGRPRSAGVFAVVDSRLVRLSKTGFDRLAERHPALLNGFAWAMTPRVQRTLLAGVLLRLFDELDPLTLRDLQEQMVWRRLAAGERLFAQGDSGESLFVVVNGRLQFVAEAGAGAGQAGPRVLGEVGAGETIGEFSLLTDEPRSASVYAVRESDVVELSRPVFEQLARRHPEVMGAIARGIARRQQRALGIGTVAPVALNLTLVPAGGGADLQAAAVHLAAALGDARILSAGSFDEAFGRPGAAVLDADDPVSLVINGWLQEQAALAGALLFVAGSELNNWTRRCLGHADRVVAVGSASADPSLNPVERAIPERTPTTVVLLDRGHEPVGEWQLLREGRRIVRVRQDVGADWDALARILTQVEPGSAAG